LIIIYPLKQKLHPEGKGEKYYFMPPPVRAEEVHSVHLLNIIHNVSYQACMKD